MRTRKRTTSIRGRTSSPAGFTFVEIIMALAIGAGLIGFALTYLGGTPFNLMKKESLRIMRVVRFAYYQAASQGRYYRVSFNLDEQSYIVEASDSAFAIAVEGDEKEELRKRNEEKESDESAEEEASASPPPSGFAEIEEEGFGVLKIPDGIRLDDVYVMHQKEPASTGRAYLYFFPRGQTEFAVMHLIEPPEPDENGEIPEFDPDEGTAMTLIVNPLTGSIEAREEYVEHEDIADE